ncbi:TorF family putative porin [Methylophaga sp. OBS4]|uniref:TorF family putative porin n=1 Tax=Methylophaga sp. OBS4 TaxID=2991935 RepID=UPI00224F2B38|nr:TorF family putative porin [Methylophaga sp. OBS4]MCX4187977.1 TorF family putative porin [Methylophaga sp. OBS4]
MKKSICSLIVLSSTSLFSSMSLADGAMDVDNFSANIGLTTNYLFRGITLSDDHGAVSGGFDWGYNGFYLGTWASSIDAVETESFEIDYYGGYTGEINGFAYSLDVIYYDYPGEAGSGDPEDIGDLAYWEYGGSLAYNFDTSLAPTLGVSVLHSPDFFAETGDATAIESSLDLSLPYELGLTLHYGTQKLDDDFYDVDSYDYYGIALSKTVGKFDVTVGYSDTDSDGETFQGSETDELYLSISASI